MELKWVSVMIEFRIDNIEKLWCCENVVFKCVIECIIDVLQLVCFNFYFNWMAQVVAGDLGAVRRNESCGSVVD